MQTNQKPKGKIHPLTLPGTLTCLVTEIDPRVQPRLYSVFLTFDEEALEIAQKENENSKGLKIPKISADIAGSLMTAHKTEILKYVLELQAFPCLVRAPTSAVIFGDRAWIDPFWTSTTAISYLKSIAKSGMIAHENAKCMGRLVEFAERRIPLYNDAIVDLLKKFHETFRSPSRVEEIVEERSENVDSKKSISTREEIKIEGSKFFEAFEIVTRDFMRDLTRHLDEICLIAALRGNSEKSIEFIVSKMHRLEDESFAKILEEKTGVLVPEFDEIPKKALENLRSERTSHLRQFKQSCNAIPNFKKAFDISYVAVARMLWRACKRANIEIPKKRNDLILETFCKVVSGENYADLGDVLSFAIILKTLLIG
jgi:hypothetical protein